MMHEAMNNQPEQPAPPDQQLPILSCDDCGACCLSMVAPPFCGPNDPDKQSLPDDVAADYERGLDELERNGWPEDTPCFWLDLTTRQCRHYEHRPSVCRDFDVGSLPCRSWRQAHHIETKRS